MPDTYIEIRICATCKWHHIDEIGDWYCVNAYSNYCTEWTDYDDTCPEWEEKERRCEK